VTSLLRSLTIWTLLALAGGLAHAQYREGAAMLLVAEPGLHDADYSQTVIIAGPSPNGGHVGVILNRPTRRSLGSLFPEHEPSKLVREPVYYGGPSSRDALVALVRAGDDPGGAVPLTKNLYLAFRATTIDHVIETTPNQARYYVGYVGWRPGELRREIGNGLWSVLAPDVDTVFRKDTEGLWEELLQQSHGVRAAARCQAAAFACAFSKFILPPRKSTTMVSFGAKRPSRMAFDSGFSISDWIARLSGRAPYTGSKPTFASSATAASETSSA